MVDATSHEHYMEKFRRQSAAMEHMKRENALLRGALLIIDEWKMPYPGYGWDNGSNGERDYFRSVARRALTSDAPQA